MGTGRGSITDSIPHENIHSEVRSVATCLQNLPKCEKQAGIPLEDGQLYKTQ